MPDGINYTGDLPGYVLHRLFDHLTDKSYWNVDDRNNVNLLRIITRGSNSKFQLTIGVKNYRPIALTSHLIKVFEKVLSKSIVAFMETNNLFNPGQHGFRHGRSCLSQLITHYDHILDLLEQGHNVDVVYIDFAKAFDKVDFMVTMHKLISLGISGKVGKWIYSFLTHRTQQVIVNKSFSKPIEVKSGVPQGSVPGPLIFLILIGDINKDVNEAILSSFADDTRIGRQIGSQNDSELLQKDLCAVYNWTLDNNMELNASKFECSRYGPNSDLQQFPYKSNTGCTIEERDHLKDLGVTMCRDGTFKKHIQTTVKTAQNQCSWILRTFMTREVIPMLTLWKSLVQCKLDYCSQLWSPARKGDIHAIEMVQNSFLRKLPAIRHTRQVTRAPRLSLSRNTIMNFQTGKRYQTIRHCWFLHTPYKRIGYVIIPKPHFQGVNV